MKRIFLPLALMCGLSQVPAFSQGVLTTTTPFTTSPVAVPSAIPTNSSYNGTLNTGTASPIRPLRSYYPRTVIQNPSNPWLPPNLNQVNTTLIPVGSTSPNSTLTQPTSVLNTPGSAQQLGYPTVPVYNIGTLAPTSQNVASGSGSTVPTSLATPTSLASPANPGNFGSSTLTNFNSVSRSNPTNPLYP